MAKTAVVALGGDSILRPTQQGSAAEQRQNLVATCTRLVELVADGWRLVLTHGNGPQVGNLILQNEHARSLVPAMPLDVCGAQSQAQIGYLLQNSLENALYAAGLNRPVACLLTRVEVDDADPSFLAPVKAVGPIYTAAKAMDLMRLGVVMKEGERGWRQVVPSPQPRQVLEKGAIRDLLECGYIVVAAGGGGIPVVRGPEGDLTGVAAVLEKDLTTSLLASELAANLLVYLTSVPGVVLDTEGAAPAAVRELTVEQALRLTGGRLPRESMGVKVEAAVQFVHRSGNKAIITNVENLPDALAGVVGTSIVAAATAGRTQS